MNTRLFLALEAPTGKQRHEYTDPHRSDAVTVRHLKCIFFYLTVTEGEDNFVPVFETQVPDWEQSQDSQYLEQRELIKIEHEIKSRRPFSKL